MMDEDKNGIEMMYYVTEGSGKGKGYVMEIAGFRWPMPPNSMTISYGNKNKTIDLANGAEMNLRKLPGLAEISMEVTLPYRTHPSLRGWGPPKQYIEHLTKLKTEKACFSLSVYRYGLGWEEQKWHFSQMVTLEDFSYSQEASEGEDVTLSLSFKQWKAYKTKKVTISKGKDGKTTTTTNTTKPSSKPSSDTYTVRKYDNLRSIAKRKLGSENRWKEIYTKNKKVIEAEAKKHGRKSSGTGHYIYPGTKLKLPKK